MNPAFSYHRHYPHCITLGVTGGSGSGKSTFVKAICHSFPQQVTILSQDLYYLDLSSLPREERIRINFDHPDSLEWDLMVHHIDRLALGEPVQVPIYDFHLHTRVGEESLHPGALLVVEGTLVLVPHEIRSRMDCTLFIDTPNEIRFARRLERDQRERGRQEAEIRHQYSTTVQPMYERFIEPTQKYADRILDGTQPLPDLVNQFWNEFRPFFEAKS